MTEFDSESDRRQVMAASDEEMGAIVAGDPERYFNVLTDDAVFLPPSSMPKAGDELRQWLRDFLAQVTIECLDSVHGETVVAGNIAYHEYACTWRVTPKSGGQPAVTHFKGLHIARRLPDGSWKLARNIWNTSPAAGL